MITLRMVSTSSVTLTNWLGNRVPLGLLKAALAFTVPVEVSIWLSNVARTPWLRLVPPVRSKAVTCRAAPVAIRALT